MPILWRVCFGIEAAAKHYVTAYNTNKENDVPAMTEASIEARIVLCVDQMGTSAGSPQVEDAGLESTSPRDFLKRFSTHLKSFKLLLDTQIYRAVFERIMPISLCGDIMMRVEEPLEVIMKGTRIPDTGNILEYVNSREWLKATEGGVVT